MKNAINWFELAATDLDRATRFYETTLAISLRRETFFGTEMAMFIADERGVGGALVKDQRRAPGGGGSLVYLSADGKLDACLERVAGAGGQVVTAKVDIGDFGTFALVRDTEGNVVGLHSSR